MYNEDNDDLVQPTLGFSDAEMLQRQNALASVRTLEDWYRMYPQHQSRWAKRGNDKVAQTYAHASALLNGVPANTGKVMTSRYDGRCADCGGWIAAGDTIRYDGKAHHYPECTQETALDPMADWDDEAQNWATQAQPRVTNSPAPRTDVSHTEATPGTTTARAVPDGKYTLQFEDGHRHTFKINTQKTDASFAAGKRVVKYLSGSDNAFESSYTGFAFLNDDGTLQVWSRFKNDSQLVKDAMVLCDSSLAKEAGLRYSLESTCCFLCGHELTVTESILEGVGPVCAKRLAAM